MSQTYETNPVNFWSELSGRKDSSTAVRVDRWGSQGTAHSDNYNFIYTAPFKSKVSKCDSRWSPFSVKWQSQFPLWWKSTGVDCKQTLASGCVPLCCICICICPTLLHLPSDNPQFAYSQPAVKSLCLQCHLKARVQYCRSPHFSPCV